MVPFSMTRTANQDFTLLLALNISEMVQDEVEQTVYYQRDMWSIE